MLIRKIKTNAVIFDMDGVITNTMPDHFHAWKEVLKCYQIHATYEDIYCREGQRGIQSVEEIFKKYGRTFSLKEGKKILLEKEEFFKKIVKHRFIQGSRRFLKRLHKENFVLALVTGTSRHELHRILPDGIYQLFSVIVTGSDVRNGKPHPEPFLKALKQLKLSPASGVVIENAPFGIEAAKQAGLRCIALETSLPRKFLKKADAVFTSIKELEMKVKFVSGLG
ncbi:MAG: HAD-IA family hydrolase [Candidatus Omnitrophica bacterium]|nr:HAD-IA family hydrolase [Candidatus Omnitrophota bacterium]